MSIFNKIRCSGTNKDGSLCKNEFYSNGRSLCSIHENLKNKKLLMEQNISSSKRGGVVIPLEILKKIAKQAKVDTFKGEDGNIYEYPPENLLREYMIDYDNRMYKGINKYEYMDYNSLKNHFVNKLKNDYDYYKDRPNLVAKDILLNLYETNFNRIYTKNYKG